MFRSFAPPRVAFPCYVSLWNHLHQILDISRITWVSNFVVWYIESYYIVIKSLSYCIWTHTCILLALLTHRFWHSPLRLCRSLTQSVWCVMKFWPPDTVVLCSIYKFLITRSHFTLVRFRFCWNIDCSIMLSTSGIHVTIHRHWIYMNDKCHLILWLWNIDQ